MLVLWERGALPLNELGAALRLDSGTLSPLLKRLESAGLVSRTRSPDDERLLLVGLTPEGEVLRRRARRVPAELLASMGMTVHELTELRRTLHALTESLNTPPNQKQRSIRHA
jgi:DNA-binding MarR family transcriptional regulator